MKLEKPVEELSNRLLEMKMENTGAFIVMLMMRIPERAEAMLDYLNKHPEATEEEIERMAGTIARTVKPTTRNKPARASEE